ncbi:oxidoreductase [Spirochaetia bacterium]|nr:oxidoreductase [Spirochaetia bacterium]
MKRLALHNKKAYLEEVSLPEPHDEWVLIKIMSAPICGGDKKAFLSEERLPYSKTVYGHEGTGIVEAVKGSNMLKAGDRVILNPLAGCGKCYLCRSGNYIHCKNKPAFDTNFAEYALVQDFVCTPLPDDISYDTGSLACCTLGPAYRAVRQLNLQAFDTILISGLGPVGLGAIAIAKFLGARVIAVGNNPYRRHLAQDLGADAMLDPEDPDIAKQIEAAKSKAPLLKGIECSGSSKAERLALDSLDRLGTLTLIGQNHTEIPIRPSEDFIAKGLSLVGIWHYNMNDAEGMYAILRHAANLDKLITHRFALSDAQSAFEELVLKNNGKIVIKPW